MRPRMAVIVDVGAVVAFVVDLALAERGEQVVVLLLVGLSTFLAWLRHSPSPAA